MRKMLIGLGSLIVLYAGFILVAPLFGSLPDIRRPVAPITNSTLVYETVHLASAQPGIELTAWWMPSPTPRAVMILVHGLRGQRAMTRFGGVTLAEKLVAAGYSVLSIDLRGHGDSDAAPDGSLNTSELPLDLIGAVDWVETKAPGLPIGVLGASLGGDVVIRTASQEPRIVAVIAVDAALAPIAAAENFLVTAMSLPRIVAQHLIWSMQYVHGGWNSESAVEAGARLDGARLMLIHNEADPVSPVSGSRELKSRLPKAQLWVTPAPAPDNPILLSGGTQGTHVLSFRLYPDIFLKKVLGFLDSRFGGT